MGSNHVEVTEANFETEVLKSDIPVLVDFWAVWCGPCRAIAPTLDQIAEEYKGKLKVGKLNVDENQNLATRYHITGIPTLLIFKGGEVAQQIVGAVPKAKIVNALNSIL